MLTTYISWISKIIVSIVQIYSVRILIEYLGLEEYAAYLILVAMLPWIALLDFGFGSAFQNQFSININNSEGIDRLKNLVLNFQIFILIINIPIVIILSLTFHAAVEIVNIKSNIGIFNIMLLVYFLFAINTSASISYKVLYSFGRGYLSNLFPAFASILSLCLLTIFKIYQFNDGDKLFNSLLSLAIPTLLMSFLSNFCILRKTIDKLSLKIYISEFKNYAKNATNFWFFSILVAASTNFDYFIIAKTLKSSEVVEYGLLAKFFSFSYYFVYAHMLALWPKFSESLNSGNTTLVSKHLKQVYWSGIIFIIIFTFILVFLKENIASILTQKEVEISTTGVIMFGFYYVVRVVYDGMSVAICSINLHKYIVYYMPAQAVVSALMQYYLSLYYGVAGVAAGLAISFLIVGIPFNLYIYFRKVCRF